VSADERFNRMESGYQLEETARLSQDDTGMSSQMILMMMILMILECHRVLTGMHPFVMAMKEGRYGL